MDRTVDILAFSPHPDDAELGCAGSLILAIQKGLRAAIDYQQEILAGMPKLVSKVKKGQFTEWQEDDEPRVYEEIDLDKE